MILKNVLNIYSYNLKFNYFKIILLIHHIKFNSKIVVLSMPKYAVARGKKSGIYDTWKECEEQVKGYNGAIFKKFDSLSEAEDFIEKNSNHSEVIKNYVKIKTEVESFPVPKISPANVTFNGLYTKLQQLEDNVNNFMRETRATLFDLRNRVTLLESNGNDTLNFSKPKGTKRTIDPEDDVKEDVIAKALKVNEDVSPISVILHSKFITNENGYVCVYTDGACTNNGKLGAKAGIGVWFNEHHPLNVSEPVRGYATNNNAEIQAATKAILQASKAGVTNLNIHTDSQFMIKCITSWIHKWKRNNWTLSDGGPVKNKEELICLDEAIRNMNCVKWTYVKGHSGNIGNTEADSLARKGAALYDCNVTYGNQS